jgi:hypothetical protein
MASLKPMALLKPFLPRLLPDPDPYFSQPLLLMKIPEMDAVRNRLKLDINKDPQALMTERFHTRNIAIKCFTSMEDVETKVLTDKPEILIVHSSFVERSAESTAHRKFDYQDIYHIKRKEGQEVIYYKDVIEFFVENGYGSMDANRVILYDIQPVERWEKPRKHTWSLPVFALHWLPMDSQTYNDRIISLSY